MSNFIRFLLTFVLVLLTTCQSFGQSAPVSGEQAFVEWVRKTAIPLKTVEAGNGFDDMEPLGKLVRDARIVALGEATHGTREFFQLKHRIIEYLATRKGFTVFAIEANMPEAYRLNDFVLHGQGDPKQLLKGMYFWTWDTQEVLDLILWMREFNRSGKGHIEFTGFDMQTPTVAVEVVKSFVQQHEPTYADRVEQAYRQITQMGRSSFGVATATFPVGAAAGKHIKYSGFIRTDKVEHGYAGLWWRVDGQPKAPPLAFDNMNDRGATDTTGWTRYEISLDVPATATNINFGVLDTGTGTAWFDSLQVEIDGVAYNGVSGFDLDFESSSPKGFYTGGQGYQLGLDTSVAHSGKQSLRSTAINEFSNQKDSEERCKSVLAHLEDERTELIQHIPAGEVDWAIQNARVVLQSAQLATGEQSRDESMADNVRWIADHSAGAKLILWAHNGHVAFGRMPSYTPMGTYLRKKFGVEYLNFGFSFNEGSFRAVEVGKQLRDFTVGPAPEGSLDQALSLAQIPPFVIDLRQLPKEGPAASWVSQPHITRSIGAVYSDWNAGSYSWNTRIADQFDALLFVNKTTAARGN